MIANYILVADDEIKFVSFEKQFEDDKKFQEKYKEFTQKHEQTNKPSLKPYVYKRVL